MAHSLPKRSFIHKTRDAIGTVLASPVVALHKRKQQMHDNRADAIRRGRDIPASVLGQMTHKDPAFQAKMGSINAKADILRDAAQQKKRQLRAKWPQNHAQK